MQISKLELTPWQEGIKREWLLTNGLGGYASGTAAGINTRRYHGLLMAALAPPGDRTLLVAKTEDTLDGVPLGANLYREKILAPLKSHQESFTPSPTPTFLYRVGGKWLEKRIFMVHDASLTIVEYKLRSLVGSGKLTVRPLITHRHFHYLIRQNDWSFSQSKALGGRGSIIEAYPGAAPIYLLSDRALYQEEGMWYQNFLYFKERERGLDFEEDLYAPGFFQLELAPNETVAFAFATELPHSEYVEELLVDFEVGKARTLWERELERTEDLWRRAGKVLPLTGDDPITLWARDLVLAADDFIVGRQGGERTIIAGYPWFGDWGRDSMIAIEGLTLVTGRFEEAWEILTSIAKYVQNGLLPNCFPDSCREPAYNSVDAPLWFINGVYRYWQYTEDEKVRELYPQIRAIVEHYKRGTSFGIRMDEDGLITMADGQLTWMDAKVGDWVVTPRAGKPIEIQALWHNALEIVSIFAAMEGDNGGEDREIAAKVRESSRKYWQDGRGIFADLLGDAKFRSNQLLAFSLPFPLFNLQGEARVMAMQVLENVLAKLYIGPGLRSLGPDEPGYKGRYGGGVLSRDGAYHQGTAWSWTLGSLLELMAKLEPDPTRARQKLWQLLGPSYNHFYFEGALGQISEIFDGDWPHEPKGAFAQGWGVAEILRIVSMYLLTERGWQYAHYDA